MMDTVPTEDDRDDEESTDEDEHEHFEQTASGCLSTLRCRKIQALFQTMCNTPFFLYVMNHELGQFPPQVETHIVEGGKEK